MGWSLRTRSLVGLAALSTLPLVAAAAMSASAHQADEPAWQAKRDKYEAGVQVPLLSSPNVKLVDSVPAVTAISGCHMKSAPVFVTSGIDSITVFDTTDPLHPKVAGVLDNIVFENEAMNCGERTVDGKTVRFVLVGIDLTQTSTGDVEHVRPVGFDEFMVVDVTDPAKPRIRSRAETTSSTHTVACVKDTACDYAYTAGGSIVDLTDLDNPFELKDPARAGTSDSPALDENPGFGGSAGHKWNFDEAGYGIHTGSGGSAIYDVSDPVSPRLVADTDARGVSVDWNNFIHHNADRPNAGEFVAGAAPSVPLGNVLLVTEEDYMDTQCSTAGSFQTWHVTSLDGSPDSIRPLDRINPVGTLEGIAGPQMGFCSAHWFDYHQSGIVAQGYYEGGLRLIDVRNPRDIKQYGYFASGLSEVWDAYWYPVRNSHGIATGKKTNIVYTADVVRGLDVFTVTLP